MASPPVRRIYASAWRAAVISRVDELEDELARVGARPERPPEGASDWSETVDYRRACANLATARAAVVGSSGHLLGRWASGSSVETARRALHAAEAALLMIQDAETVRAQLPELRAALATTLGPRDGRIAEYEAALEGCAQDVERSRQRIRVIKSAVDAASDNARGNLRNYRNWLIIIGVIALVGLVIAAIVHALQPRFLFICQAVSAADHACGPNGANVAEFEGVGALGGLIAALFALRRLNVYSGPYALPLWLALLRVPAGAAGALVGVLLLQGGLVNALVPQPKGPLLASAVVFGAAPEVVLRLLDQKANSVGSAAANKSDPQKTVPAADGASPGARGPGEEAGVLERGEDRA